MVPGDHPVPLATLELPVRQDSSVHKVHLAPPVVQEVLGTMDLPDLQGHKAHVDHLGARETPVIRALKDLLGPRDNVGL